MKKCPRFFSIARTILKQEVDPPWSTTTIVSCSTSLHRQPLSWYRRWTMKSDPCCIVVNPRTPKCQCCLWAARLAPVDKKIKPWTQRKLDRVLFNIKIWGVGFYLVMSVTVGFDFFVHLLYVSPFNSGENNISHGISSPGLKTHLMSGHFQWSKTKKDSIWNPTWFFSMLFTMNHRESHPLSDVLHGPSSCTLGLLMNSCALATVNCTSPTAAKTPLSAADRPRPTPKPTPTATPRLTPGDFRM